jgi:hypothetical protein|tara:strand:+ start:688 stop:843 length:156 start_codon:yes stop_codon:yes gene_type:complete
MKRYKITYEDYIDAECLEQAIDILMAQLDMDVKNKDSTAFDIIVDVDEGGE